MHRPRPYWHVDAKWLFGLSLSFWLACSLGSYALWRLTAPDLALPLATQIVSYLASQQSENGSSGVPEVDKVEITRLLTASYEGALPPDSPIQNFGPLAALNRSNHNVIGKIWPLTALIGLLEIFGLVRFSYHWGRLVSPAVVALMVALPGALAFWLTATLAGRGHDGLWGIEPATLAHTAQVLGQPFIAVTGVSVALLLLAAIGRIATRQRPLKADDASLENNNPG